MDKYGISNYEDYNNNVDEYGQCGPIWTMWIMWTNMDDVDNVDQYGQCGPKMDKTSNKT